MKISRYFTALLLLIMCTGVSVAQENASTKTKTPLMDRLFFGGGLGLSFGSSTYIYVAPLVGYKITEKFHTGVTFTYIYEDSKVQVTQTATRRFSTSHYGGSVFLRYYPIENFFAHTEYEYLNAGIPYFNPYTTEIKIQRETQNNIYVGGGYAQPIGDNAALMLMVLYNLNESANSFYTNPQFRIGFSAGF